MSPRGDAVSWSSIGWGCFQLRNGEGPCLILTFSRSVAPHTAQNQTQTWEQSFGAHIVDAYIFLTHA